MNVLEVLDIYDGTIKGKIVWKQTLNQIGFAYTHDGVTNYEIVQESEYLYKLTKFDSSHNPMDSLQNPEPLPGELTTRGHLCDKNGSVSDEEHITPWSANSPQAYILIRLYEAAKKSAGFPILVGR
jgi:hypothetical protein